MPSCSAGSPRAGVERIAGPSERHVAEALGQLNEGQAGGAVDGRLQRAVAGRVRRSPPAFGAAQQRLERSRHGGAADKGSRVQKLTAGIVGHSGFSSGKSVVSFDEDISIP